MLVIFATLAGMLVFFWQFFYYFGISHKSLLYTDPRAIPIIGAWILNILFGIFLGPKMLDGKQKLLTYIEIFIGVAYGTSWLISVDSRYVGLRYLMFIGSLLNLLVITVNKGKMPVLLDVVRKADPSLKLLRRLELQIETEPVPIHVLVESARLEVLADRLRLSYITGGIISAGDCFIYTGLIVGAVQLLFY